MFQIIFYEDKKGKSKLCEELLRLEKRSIKSKNDRIIYKEIVMSIELLQRFGTRLPTIETKYLGNKIWELRPGKNRILYFYYENNTYVLLHIFRKTTQKTPNSEIKKAINEMNDFIARNGGSK